MADEALVVIVASRFALSSVTLATVGVEIETVVVSVPGSLLSPLHAPNNREQIVSDKIHLEGFISEL